MKCVYCGKYCGLFKNEHDRCRLLAGQGKKYLRECIDYIYENRDCMNIAEVIRDTVSRHKIPAAMAKKLFLECWNAKVLAAFDDGVLEADEIRILGQMVAALEIGPAELAGSAQWQRLVVHARKDISEAVDAALCGGDFASLKQRVGAIAGAYGFSPAITKKLLLECWEKFLDKVLEDKLLEKDEETLLTQLTKALALEEADVAPYRVKIVRAAILREVLNGIIPKRFKTNRPLRVALQKNETVIWVSRRVPACEAAPGSSGGGAPAGTGVRGPAGIAETARIGSGDLIITDLNIFWASPSQTIKIPVMKLASVIADSCGVTLLEGGATARSVTFRVDDPWFISNLARNLHLLH